MTKKTVRSVISKMIVGVEKAKKDFPKEKNLTKALKKAIFNGSLKESNVSASENATGFFSTDTKNKKPDIVLSASGEIILVEVKLITDDNYKYEPRNALLQAIEYGMIFKPHSVILAYSTKNGVSVEIDKKTELLVGNLSKFAKKYGFRFFVVDLKKRKWLPAPPFLRALFSVVFCKSASVPLLFLP